MNTEFESSWNRLERAAQRWEAPSPNESETQRLADGVLRGLRTVAVETWTGWAPLARNMALASVVLALTLTILQPKAAPSPAMEPDSLASAFVLHSLKPTSPTTHE